MEPKHEEPQLRLWRTSRHSTTPALEDSFGSNCLRPSATDNLGIRPSKKQQKMRSSKHAGDGHMSSPDLEPTGKEKERLPKKHTAPWSGSWNKEYGLHFGTSWDAGPWWGYLDSPCRWPMLKYGPKEIKIILIQSYAMETGKVHCGCWWIYLSVCHSVNDWHYFPSFFTLYCMPKASHLMSWSTQMALSPGINMHEVSCQTRQKDCTCIQ